MHNNFIRADKLKAGDVFKVNPRLSKEHWVQSLSKVKNEVTVSTWACVNIKLQADQEVFLIRESKENQQSNF